MKNNCQNRIEKVKSKLILEQPYFGTIASSLKTKLNENIQSFQTSLNLFEYNDTFVDTLDDNQLAYILTNCAMHHALIDNTRQINKAKWLWTLAKDYSINSLLIKNGLKAPLVVNYDKRFDNLNSEIIYDILYSEITDKKNSESKVEHIKHQKETIDTNDIKNINEQLLNKAKQYGTLPLGIDIVFPKIYQNKINWQEKLYDIVLESVKFDYQLLQ